MEKSNEITGPSNFWKLLIDISDSEIVKNMWFILFMCMAIFCVMTLLFTATINLGSPNNEWKNVLSTNTVDDKSKVIIAIGRYDTAVMKAASCKPLADIQFDSDFYITRGIAFISAALSTIFTMIMLTYTITNIVRYKYRDVNYDEKYFYCSSSSIKENIWNGVWQSIMGICIVGASIFCFYKCDSIYQKGQQIYSEAVYAIPLDFDKDTYMKGDLSEKFKIVNSYLANHLEKGTPLMYRIDEKRYVPFEDNYVVNTRDMTVIDKIMKEKK